MLQEEAFQRFEDVRVSFISLDSHLLFMLKQVYIMTSLCILIFNHKSAIVPLANRQLFHLPWKVALKL